MARPSNRLGARVAASVAAVNLLAAILVIGAPTATAQTLAGDYQFQDSFSGGTGTPPFAPIGTTTFATETVDGVQRRVLTWAAGNGLRLHPTSQLNTSTSYTIVMLVRFQQVDGYRRILDFKQDPGPDGQRGLYVSGGTLLFFKFNSIYGPASINPNTWVQIVLTRDAAKTFKGYVNGVEQFSFVDADDDAIAPKDALHFFDDAQAVEETSGAISRFRLYRDAMTGPQVAGLDRLPGSQPTSTSPTPTSASPSPTSTLPSPSSSPTSASPTPSPTPSATPTSASPTPTTTPTRTPTPTPTPSQTGQPTPTPDPTNTPPPGPTQFVVVPDEDDVAGPLDIKSVAMRKVTFYYSLKLELFGKVKESTLRFKKSPGSAWIYLDTAPDQGPRRPEYRVRVFHDGIDWGSETQRLSDGKIVGSDIAEKLGPKTLQFTVETDDVDLQQDSIWFFGETTFTSDKKKSKCKKVCRDNAPGKGFADSGA